MKKFSVEILPKQKSKISELKRDYFEDIFITHIPGSPLSDLIDASKEVKISGFNPVPHIPARSFEGYDVLENTLLSLKNAGVSDLLVIAGSSSVSAGPFNSTLDMFKTDLFNKLNFRNLRIAGHPEGNPDDKDSKKSLSLKLLWLKNHDFTISIVTQFCLSSSVSNNWIKETRKTVNDFSLPNVDILIGLAGPSKITTLLKYAKVCGVNASASFLKRQGLDIAKIINHSPEIMINQLTGHDGVHFFPFGGISELNKWLDNRN